MTSVHPATYTNHIQAWRRQREADLYLLADCSHTVGSAVGELYRG